ncbi:glycosyltransferase [Candidatus Poribacteria bacterium]|nr:glycosyltransferase [Candidatus Poribacteria bacterium]
MVIGINALSITPDSTGGGTTYILELINQLSKIDSENKYIIFIRKDSAHHFNSYSTNFIIVKIFMPARFSVAFRVLIDLLFISFIALKYELDVLFCPIDSIPIWTPCASVMVIQNLLYFHDELNPAKHIGKRRFHSKVRFWYYKQITLRSALRADKIITVSENAKREIIDYFRIDDSKVSVAYHGIGKHFRNIHDETENIDGYILYVGALLPYKNIESILFAVSELKNRNLLTCKVNIVGPDYYEYKPKLRSLADELGISDVVVFSGYIPYEKLPLIYQKANLFVLLSRCESFGMPVLEAMQSGCPVVCSNLSSLPEIVGDAGVLVDPDDVKETADAMERILMDEKYRKRLVSKGKLRAKEFSWEKTARQTLEAMKQAFDFYSG